jgi:hypothetical protein
MACGAGCTSYGRWEERKRRSTGSVVWVNDRSNNHKCVRAAIIAPEQNSNSGKNQHSKSTKHPRSTQIGKTATGNQAQAKKPRKETREHACM